MTMDSFAGALELAMQDARNKGKQVSLPIPAAATMPAAAKIPATNGRDRYTRTGVSIIQSTQNKNDVLEMAVQIIIRQLKNADGPLHMAMQLFPASLTKQDWQSIANKLLHGAHGAGTIHMFVSRPTQSYVFYTDEHINNENFMQSLFSADIPEFAAYETFVD